MRDLNSWSRLQAGLMLLAAAAAFAVKNPWPLPAVACVSFGALLVRNEAAFRRRGALAPNLITSLRLLLALLLGLAPATLTGRMLAVTLLLILALDGIDGWLARKNGATSAFGAHFDMETDAFAVVVAGLVLFTRAELPFWLLLPCLLRYVYVLWIALLPPPWREPPATQLGRLAFVALVLGLCAALGFPGAIGLTSLALGGVCAVLSFARSFYYVYFRPA